MIKAVIFDFDGVLVDTAKPIFDVCRGLGINLDHEKFRKFQEENIFKTVGKSVFFRFFSAKFFKKYNSRVDVGHFFPVIPQVRKLVEKYRLFIVSSGSEKIIKKYLSLAGINGCFEEILGMETGRSKAKKLINIREKHHFQPDECIFITDTLGDILEAKEAKTRTIAVTWGFHDKKRLVRGKPDIIIDSFHDLEKAVIDF